MKSTQDFCHFHTDGNDKNFGVVGLQIDNIFILINNIIAAAKEKKLKEANLLLKKRKKPKLHILIKFNKGYILLADDNKLFLNQEKQYQYLRWIAMKEFID